MDFAPYQDQAPEQSRALSPPPQGRPQSPRSTSQREPFVQQAAPQHQAYRASQRSYEEDYNNEDDDEEASYQAGDLGQTGTGARADPESGRGLDLFATSLPLRMDYEAMLAYLLLPPAGGVLLLILEHRSDYVRYVCLGARPESGNKANWIGSMSLDSMRGSLHCSSRLPLFCI